MSRITVGVVDYGVGNHASVRSCLLGLGFRCWVTSDPVQLASADLLLLPGVGAFPAAMEALARTGTDEFIIGQASRKQPILGICLGMQLLAQISHEHGETRGLGLIPGMVLPIVGQQRWHIGWNEIEVPRSDSLLGESAGQAFYFNHSFAYTGPQTYICAVASQGNMLTAAIRRGQIMGLQFHPEKSQIAGQKLLHRVITGLARG